MVNKYTVLDEAIERLKAWRKTEEVDNGIRGLVSGGSFDSMNKWYVEMEAARTPAQRAAEITQKLARENYEPYRKKALAIIQKAQKQSNLPTFAIADYENEWNTFKAPNLELARKFLMILENRTTYLEEIVRASEIKPALTAMDFAS